MFVSLSLFVSLPLFAFPSWPLPLFAFPSWPLPISIFLLINRLKANVWQVQFFNYQLWKHFGKKMWEEPRKRFSLFTETISDKDWLPLSINKWSHFTKRNRMCIEVVVLKQSTEQNALNNVFNVGAFLFFLSFTTFPVQGLLAIGPPNVIFRHFFLFSDL